MKKEEFEAMMLGLYVVKNNFSIRPEMAKLYFDAVADCYNHFIKLKLEKAFEHGQTKIDLPPNPRPN